MDYLEVRFYNDVSLNEALIAWLGESDFQMFEEHEDGISAFIPEQDYKEEKVAELIRHIPGNENIRFEKSFIKDRNWNKEWESNFEPVTISDILYVRAPFHKAAKNGLREIVIEPKMSFGTGHHATTALMIELMAEPDFKGKSVLDMGCGSGVLAIFAKQLEADDVLAVDIDDWSIENTRENCLRNQAPSIRIQKGDVNVLGKEHFDFILANINRNVLLNDLNVYCSVLKSGGSLLISGFLTEDIDLLVEKASTFGLKKETEKRKEAWAALRFIK
ncbi:MAG TPA: 50S ribosomal protein L11 methyltransferase [Bacteroidia bacterium]|nr:50S ribosomal protein L11 methyltransferase [Bacteroidia bacterium]